MWFKSYTFILYVDLLYIISINKLVLQNEFRQKYSAARRLFNSLLSVWKYDETLSLVFNILLT